MLPRPPEDAPVYPGEIQAVNDVQAHGWTCWWDDTGYGIYDSITATHPTNPASPMILASFEDGSDRRWWWRPMVLVGEPVGTPTDDGNRRSPYRIETWKPRLRGRR